tara:strand:+ start:115 stop:582 length:468 start_codon:yes stop_codon:yes gene_type:complete
MNKVAFLIGSESDRVIVEHSNEYFEYFDIEHEIIVMSAHRNPVDVHEFSKNAKSNGYLILVCGAGMAAHLAGAVKSNTILPVIGVPLPGGMMDGLDSLLSTVNMPKGVPVATSSVGKAGAINAAILSAEIIALNNEDITKKLIDFKDNGSTLSGL